MIVFFIVMVIGFLFSSDFKKLIRKKEAVSDVAEEKIEETVAETEPLE